MKRVVIDIDGVTCAHADAICKQINLDYDLNIKTTDVISWDYNFGKISFIEAVNKYYPIQDFILSMPLTPGIRNFIDRILERNYEIIFATWREHSHEATRQWIRQNIGSKFDVIFTKEKENLAPYALIDDNEKQIVKAANCGITSILLKQPWNDNESSREMIKPFTNAHICQSFDEILLIL